MMFRIKIESEQHWHDLRRAHIGASEVSALFGEHPQTSRWDLWQRKAGNLPDPDLGANERVVWGQLIEPAIGQGVQQMHGHTVRKIHTYWTSDTTPGMAASLDFEIVTDPRGAGVLEAKTVDRLIWRDWPEDEAGERQPPLHYQLQLQHQLAVTGRGWGLLAVLIGGNELRVYEYTRDDDTIRLLRDAVTDFWRSIRADEAPEPDFQRDAARVMEMHGRIRQGSVADLTGNNRILGLVETLETARSRATDWQHASEVARAEILDLVRDHEFARLPDGRILEAPTRHRKGFTVEATTFRALQVKDAAKSRLPENDVSQMASVF